MENNYSTNTMPVPKSSRYAGLFTMFWLFAGGNVLLATFIVGSAYAEGLRLLPMVIVTVFGNLAAYTICAWSTQKNVKYGIDEVVSHRPSFGYHGSLFGVALIVFITIGWVGILSAMTGSAGQLAVKTITGGFSFTGDFSVYALLGGIIIPLVLLLIDPKIGFKLANLTVPIMIIFALYILVKLLGVLDFDAISTTTIETSAQNGWVYAFEMIFAYAVVWLPFLGAWNRFSRTEKAGFWGTYLGLASMGILFGLIGALATYKTGHMDPTMWMAELNLGVSGFVIIILGTITSSAMLLYAGIMALINIFPRWKFSLVAVGMVIPSLLYVYAGSLREIFDVVVLLGAMAAGPYWTIILVDYFFVRRTEIDLKACYDPKGIYRYYKGVNLTAVFSQLVGVSLWLYLGGWMMGFESITFVSGQSLFYTVSATLPAMIASGVTYYVLMYKQRVPYSVSVG